MLPISIMNYDVEIAKIDARGFVTLIKDTPEELIPRFYLFKQGDSATPDELFSFLADRVFPKERYNSKELLTSIGLENYNVYAIAEKTRASLIEDGLWCKYYTTDTFKYNTIKGASEHCDVDTIIPSEMFYKAPVVQEISKKVKKS